MILHSSIFFFTKISFRKKDGRIFIPHTRLLFLRYNQFHCIKKSQGKSDSSELKTCILFHVVYQPQKQLQTIQVFHFSVLYANFVIIVFVARERTRKKKLLGTQNGAEWKYFLLQKIVDQQEATVRLLYIHFYFLYPACAKERESEKATIIFPLENIPHSVTTSLPQKCIQMKHNFRCGFSFPLIFFLSSYITSRALHFHTHTLF